MNIFLSYRREDSRPFTERIYDRLVESFGVDHVFKDVDRIRPGTSFAEVLESELDRSDVMLVIIGKQWATITAKDTQQPRLNNPDDWVRLEVERGLSREDVRVIPVLVDGARLPARDDLPSSLHDLLGRQIAEVRYDPDFHRDMDRLIEALLPPPPPEPAPKRPPW
ncbi:MAG: toll/interleukin-1 receptor domain-containing protein, partial [Anaerolineae bacterium]|nr:toll/interleukin-1 receptor domain-containing protein [Anaerolineae bacterium]